MQPSDWPAVRAIYEQGIATRQATFETEPPSWEEWDAGHLAELRLVAERDGQIVGDTVLLERRSNAGEPRVPPRAPSFFADAEGRMA